MYPEYKNDVKNRRIKYSMLAVVLVVAGLVTWGVVETIQSRKAAEQAAVDIEKEVKPKTEYVELDLLGVRYSSSRSAGQVSYEYEVIGGAETVSLTASRLALAEYQCTGVNSGMFGYLIEVSSRTAEAGLTPDYEKQVGSRTFGLVNAIRPECYSEELAKQFSQEVPKAIIDSLEPIPGSD